MKNSRSLYFVNSTQASNLNYLWNLGSIIIKYSNKQSLSIIFKHINHPFNLYVKWGSHHFIKLIYDKNHYKLNITNIISFLVYHISSRIINPIRYYWTCLIGIIYWPVRIIIEILLLITGMLLLTMAVLFLEILVTFYLPIGSTFNLPIEGTFNLPIVDTFILPIEGTLLYEAHQWIKEALSIAAETMKNWPIIPNGEEPNLIVGSTGQEFDDLKRNFIEARRHVIEQKSYMLALIQEQAKLDAAFEEGLYKHQVDMKGLYQMHLDTRDARNEVKQEISDACAELSAVRANFRNVVQSLENYSKR